MLTFYRSNCRKNFELVSRFIRHYFCDLNIHPEVKEISIKGWVTSIHRLKKKTFIKLSDGRFHNTIQIVAFSDIIGNDLQKGCCVLVRGDVISSPGSKQSKEISVREYSVLSRKQTFQNGVEKLIDSKNAGVTAELARNELLQFRHRISHYAAVGRLRAGVKSAIRDSMQQIGYLEVDVPCLTTVDCEGGGESFKIATGIGSMLKNTSMQLSVSGQLHLEALVLGFGQVYSMGPIFRANKSKTRHHLSEFLMLEVETVEISDQDELCNEIESILKIVVGKILQSYQNELAIIHQSDIGADPAICDAVHNLIHSKFVRIPFKEAVEMLCCNNVVVDPSHVHQNGFGKREEKEIIRLVGGLPVFLTDFPAIQKPFYCKSSGSDTVMAVDLLLPGIGEVVGGSVRENDSEILQRNIQLAGINEASMKWYLGLRGLGGCPHAGFGLGFDRFVQFLGSIKSIQDAVQFPRTYDNCLM